MPERQTAGPCNPVRGVGSGSVDRWAARASPPEPASSRPVTMADHGAIATASAVARGGPRTNATSSSVDSRANAEVSSSGPSVIPAQRVRTMAPRFGPDSPAMMPRTSHSGIGVPAMTAIVRLATARMCTPISGGMTRCWPNRSASRAPTGPPMAPARVMDAATAPAFPYDPVSVATSIVIASPSMAIGKRPTKAATGHPHRPRVAEDRAEGLHRDYLPGMGPRQTERGLTARRGPAVAARRPRCRSGARSRTRSARASSAGPRWPRWPRSGVGRR